MNWAMVWPNADNFAAFVVCFGGGIAIGLLMVYFLKAAVDTCAVERKKEGEE